MCKLATFCKNGEAQFEELNKIGYKLKVVDVLKYHPHDESNASKSQNQFLHWDPYYFNNMLSQYEIMFKEPVPK